jgi:lysophosphatidate acyltransferase
LAGVIFINKSSKDRGISKINAEIENLKKSRTKLWMFPEGKKFVLTIIFHFISFLQGYRNHSGKIDEFKKGAFHMAINGQVPVIPVVFSSYNSFLDPKERKFYSGKIIIEALEEIPTEGLKSSDVSSLTAKVYGIMVEKFNSLNYEISKGKEK